MKYSVFIVCVAAILVDPTVSSSPAEINGCCCKNVALASVRATASAASVVKAASSASSHVYVYAEASANVTAAANTYASTSASAIISANAQVTLFAVSMAKAVAVVQAMADVFLDPKNVSARELMVSSAYDCSTSMYDASIEADFMSEAFAVVHQAAEAYKEASSTAIAHAYQARQAEAGVSALVTSEAAIAGAAHMDANAAAEQCAKRRR